jgi:ABC-type cobalamin/Fe3+-siderophores transport system ATPase subunit
LNPDINILVGINGSGKSTLLREINKYFNPSVPGARTMKIKIEPDVRTSLKCLMINTFDVPVIPHKVKDLKESILDVELRDLLYTTGQDNQLSFVNFRLKATISTENAFKINEQIKFLFSEIDKLFSKTGKRIEINPADNSLVFRTDDGTIIELTQLSSGEKQLLIILFTVFLTEGKPVLLLMDEPEISMHIEWQQQLIDVIYTINPNCQLIIATHSPSIFGDGWGDKLFFMEDIIKSADAGQE